MFDAAQSVGLIPGQLVSNIKRGDCVLFLGADLPLGYDDAPPSRPELAQALATQYDLPPDCSWPETVQSYLDRFDNDRGGLLAFLRHHLASPELRPGPTHQAIARAGFRAIVTAWYDDLLEQALREAGCCVTRVVRNKSEAYTQEGNPEVVVVKLCGSLDKDDSLVLSTREYDELMVRLDRTLEGVMAFFQLRPPLFMGFDLTDSMPRLLYTRALINTVEQDRRAFAVWPHSLDAVQRAKWGKDVVFISAQTTPLLEALVSQFPAVVSGSKGATRVNRPPFKFLDYYEPQDADIFCGRDTERQMVARLILSHRLLTLFGPSGAGKTSLLLAGVLPRLASEGYPYVYVRALDDPLLAVRKAIAARAGQPVVDRGSLRAFLAATLKVGVPASHVPRAEGQSTSYRTQLHEALVRHFSLKELCDLCLELGLDYVSLPGEDKDGKARELIEHLVRSEQLAELVTVGRRMHPDIVWNDLTRVETQSVAAPLAASDRLVIVLDQFEELFLRVDPLRRADFFREVADTLDRPERDVRFVFSLREDYLAHLDEAREFLPDIFANSFRLSALDRGHARVAITEPAARAGVTIEPALVDALVGLAPLAGGGAESGGDLVEADGRVPPATLQIVLDRLYREALPPDHDPAYPPPPGVRLELSAYRAIRRRLGKDDQTQELQGAQAILAGYVKEGLERQLDLKRIDGVMRLGADPKLGREILKAMVTSQKTKSVLTQDELLAWLDEAGAVQHNNPRDQVRVEDTRLGLERARLVRSLERDGIAYYELAHEHLAAEIARWISQEEMQTKMAREILRHALDNWKHAKLLIPLDALKLIQACFSDLRQLRPDELELVFRSALPHRYEATNWFDSARQAGVPVDDIALEGLKSDSFRTRAATVNALAQFGKQFVEPITGLLADDYPQVRVAAIRALERLQPMGEWRKHLRYECYVPAGKFIMGSDDGERDEKPTHEVHLNDFYIGKYLVTNAEYKRYMEDLKRAFQIPSGGENHPVTEVSWYDARDYAAWAGMRLLTEAEWEKAASWQDDGSTKQKAKGKKRRYPWGDIFDERKCNTAESGIGTTTPVGKYSPQGDSPYGCTDMTGNVWEWTSSLYKDYPYEPDDGREDTSSSGIRVLHGGSFYYGAGYARAALRRTGRPDSHYWNYGFRVGVAAPFSLSTLILWPLVL